MPDVTRNLLPTHNAWLTAVVLLLHITAQPAWAQTIAANTTGLYRTYYNSGFSRTPISTMPNYSSLTAAKSDFASGTSGNFANPQQIATDASCGGVYQGYLYTTASSATYIVGVQSKDGFSLAIDGSTAASSDSKSKPCCASGGVAAIWGLVLSNC